MGTDGRLPPGQTSAIIKNPAGTNSIHIHIRISGHLPAPILNGSASRLRAEPVMPLTKASQKLRKQRSRSLCFAQSE